MAISYDSIIYCSEKKGELTWSFSWINHLKFLNTIKMMYSYLTVLYTSHFSTLFLLINCYGITGLLLNGVWCSENRKICLPLFCQLGFIKPFLNKTLSLSLFLGLHLQRQRPVLLWWGQRGEGKNKTFILFLFSIELINDSHSSFIRSRQISSTIFHSPNPFFFFFIEFVAILLLFYILVFWSGGMWGLSSLTRD